MTAYFDGARLVKVRQADSFSPKEMWLWCVEHSALVGAWLTLFGTFLSFWLIWVFLSDINSRDIFIPAMLDSKVWIFVIFAGIVFCGFVTMLLSYEVWLIVLVFRFQPRDRIFRWIVRGIQGLLSIGIAVFSVALIVGVDISNQNKLTEFVIGVALFSGIIFPLVFWFLQKRRNLVEWWFPWAISVTCFLVFFLVIASSTVSWNVMRLAGITQKIDNAKHYAISKNVVPLFSINKEPWELSRKDDKIIIHGFKLFQLSEIVVLCPLDIDPTMWGSANMRDQVYKCVQIKSGDAVVMPERFSLRQSNGPG